MRWISYFYSRKFEPRFGVTAECSYGYIGDPKVVKCSGHGKPYTLDTW